MERSRSETPRVSSPEAARTDDLSSLLERVHELRELGFEAGPRLIQERDQLHAHLISTLFPEQLRIDLQKEGLSMETRIDAREKRVRVSARFYQGPEWRYAAHHSSREIIVRWKPDGTATLSVEDEDSVVPIVHQALPASLEETAHAVRQLALNNLGFEKHSAE